MKELAKKGVVQEICRAERKLPAKDFSLRVHCLGQKGFVKREDWKRKKQPENPPQRKRKPLRYGEEGKKTFPH